MAKHARTKGNAEKNSKKRKRVHTMDIYDDLLTWAQAQGIELHGIEPRAMEGRGIGIVATKQLAPDTLILKVPTTALRTLETVPKPLKKAYPKDAPVHGLLAATLALDATDTFKAWNAVVPSLDSLLSSLPLAWPSSLHALLPPPALSLLRKQQQKYAADHSIFLSLPSSLTLDASLTKKTHLYSWLLVNTRTFYHETPKTIRLRLPRDDRMVLQPVADLLNHSSHGCAVSFSPTHFTITTNREYTEGEEVVICYGRHGNDFLLVEYGFVFDGNEWDEVGLDEVILPELSNRQKELLEEEGFLGGYVLDRETVCHRTQVAVRILCLGEREWMQFVSGEDDGERDQRKVDGLLAEMLGRYVKKIEGVLEKIGGLDEGEEGQKEMLRQRWRQIRRLVMSTAERLEG